jgi:putative secretion ATPase (PEP-CTERM system associated)
MYDQYYGLSGKPFQLTPDPAFYFESATHRKAMSYLGYGLAQGEGLIVITGEIGAGKSTLVAHLMDTIDDRRLTAAQLVSTQVGPDDLIRLVATNFGIDAEGAEKADLLRDIEDFLNAQARAGKRTLLVVDEAQNLPLAALEELRMFSNFQLGNQPLMQIFLLGQPEFRDTFQESPSLEQLRQRVIATHHLEPMEADEVEPYILHRLAKVGWDGNPRFSADAMDELYAASGGIPRRLNVIAGRVLLAGAIDEASRIDGEMVRDVVADMGADADAAKASRQTAADLQGAVPTAAPVAADAAPVEFVPAAMTLAVDGDRVQASRDNRVAALEARIAELEAQIVAQERELRRAVTLMIDWLERDEAGRGAQRTRAA